MCIQLINPLMLVSSICADVLRMGLQGHVMKLVGRRGVGEAKMIHSGRMKRWRRQYKKDITELNKFPLFMQLNCNQKYNY